MPYIPKNKIQTGLYTNGGEYAFASNNQNYSGPYYKTYDGKFYSGNGPNDTTTKELILISQNDTGNPDFPSVPYDPLLPTPQDYKNGFFTRYFNIRRNQPLFTEISKDTYDKYQQRDSQVLWKLYRVFSLKWELTGDINKVAQTNKNVTELVERKEKALGLGLYLKENWIQYYKEKA